MRLYKLNEKSITSEGNEWLCSQDWPGNVRELKNVIERSVLITNHDILTTEDFITAMKTGRSSGSK